MELIQPRDPGSPPDPEWAPLALGFRPFFLAAGLAAVALMAVWLVRYLAPSTAPGPYGPLFWHAHEMLFGYTVAVIAGFLLTAVRNWTGRPTPSGLPLAGLLALWAAGRLIPLAGPGVPVAVTAAVDLAFLPVLAAVLAVPLVRAGKARNLVFVPILLALAAANALFHAGVLADRPVLADRGLALGLDGVVLLMVVMGGRVIPFFIERWFARFDRPVGVRRWRFVEAAAAPTVVALALVRQTAEPGPVVAAVAAAAALIHGLRLAGWHDRSLWRVPLLWVLWLAYGWIVLGFAMDAAAAIGWTARPLARHAYAAGGIGLLTLGMMARVALGHTGRALRPAGVVALAFGLLQLAAMARVLGPILLPAPYRGWIAGSGALWIAAFGLFVIVYTPVLLRGRVDGRPG